MDLAPTRLRGRERMDSTLQRVSSASSRRDNAQRESAPPEKVAAINQVFQRFAFL